MQFFPMPSFFNSYFSQLYILQILGLYFSELNTIKQLYECFDITHTTILAQCAAEQSKI